MKEALFIIVVGVALLMAVLFTLSVLVVLWAGWLALGLNVAHWFGWVNWL